MRRESLAACSNLRVLNGWNSPMTSDGLRGGDPLKEPIPSTRKRVLVLLLMLAALALLASSERLHSLLIHLLEQAESIMRTRPVLGRVVFVVVSAASAMLAFVSSALVVPVAIFVWGEVHSILLLWIGWTLGGLCSYSLSRYLGRHVVSVLTSESMLERYEKVLSQRASFGLVLLFQFAMPSELPGYLLGLVRYPFWKYLCVLMIVELPYAVATIYLGASFIERRLYRLFSMAIAVATLSGWAFYTLHRRFRKTPA